MFTRLLIVVLECVLFSVRVIDTTTKRLREDYPPLHGKA